MYAVLTSTPYSHFPFAEKEASPHIVAFSVNGCYAASMDINGKQILFHDILANKCETLLPFPDSFLQEEIITTMAIFDIPTLPPTIQQSKSRETSFSPEFYSVLMICLSDGEIFFFHLPTKDILLHVNLHHGPVTTVHSTPPSVSPSSIVITYSSNVVAVISSISLISLLNSKVSPSPDLIHYNRKSLLGVNPHQNDSGNPILSPHSQSSYPPSNRLIHHIFKNTNYASIHDTLLLTGTSSSHPSSSGFFTPNLKPESEYLIFRLVSGGKDPFLAQFNAITEKPSLTLDLLSGAAMGLLNLLGFRKNKPEDEKLFVPPLLTVSASHQLHQLVDSERTCSSLHLSPCGRFLAATDSLGRVSVVESETGQMLHLFKGRRNASIAWLRQKVTDSATNSSRLLLFLVIVSPQRGIVEVFLLPHFSRVGGLNIDGSVRSVQMMYPISITQPLSINEGGPLLSVSPFIANSSFEQPVYLVGNGTVYSLRVSLDPVQSLPSNTSISSPYSSTLITEITGESDTPHPSQAQTPTILLEKPKVIVEKEESSSSETENSEKSSSDG